MLSRADATMAASAPTSDEEISGEVADEFGGASGAIDDVLQAEHGRHAAPTRS
jgi:hypothetical protein